MDKKMLIVLGVFVVAVAIAGYGRITGNAFAYNLPPSCTDNDGGNNPSVQGSVDYKGLDSVKPRSFTDSCTNDRYLLEYYCEGLVLRTETIPCNCEEGACTK